MAARLVFLRDIDDVIIVLCRLHYVLLALDKIIRLLFEGLFKGVVVAYVLEIFSETLFRPQDLKYTRLCLLWHALLYFYVKDAVLVHHVQCQVSLISELCKVSDFLWHVL